MSPPQALDSIRPPSWGLVTPSWVSWAPQRGRSEADDHHVENGAGTATTQPYETLCLAEYVRQCNWGTSGGGTQNGCYGGLVCKTDSHDRRLYLIESSRCLLFGEVGDLRIRKRRGTRDGVRICACLDAQVYPIQGAALELSIPFERAGEPGYAGSTAIRMALLKTEGGTGAGRFSLYYVQFEAVQKRPICPRRGCRGFEGCLLLVA